MRPTPGWIIRRLSELPTARVEASHAGPAIGIRLGDGPQIHLDVASKLDLSSRETVELALTDRHRPIETPTQLWAIEKLKPRERQRLAEARVSWIERRTGFVHLDVPPYFIHDLGTPSTDAPKSRDRTKPVRPTKLVGLSGRCAESLVLWVGAHAAAAQNSEAPEITSSLLAELAAVSLPLANKVLNRLADEGAIVPTRRKQRTFSWAVSDSAKILDLWAAEDTRPPRVTAAYVWARSPRDLLAKLVQLNSVTDHWAVGGVAAANCYAPILTADPQATVWIPDTLSTETALRAVGGEEVSEGANLSLRQMPNDPWSLHRLRLGDQTSPNRESAGHPESSPLLTLRPAHTPPPRDVYVPGLTLVSRPRAFVETMNEQRGRSAEVADHLLGTLASSRSMANQQRPL